MQVVNPKLEAKKSKPWVHSSPSSQQSFRKHKVLIFNHEMASYNNLPRRVHSVQVVNSKLKSKELKPWVHSLPSSQQNIENIKFWTSTEIKEVMMIS